MWQEKTTGDGEENAEHNDIVGHEEEKAWEQQSSKWAPVSEEVPEETHFQRSIGGEEGATGQLRPERLLCLFS